MTEREKLFPSGHASSYGSATGSANQNGGTRNGKIGRSQSVSGSTISFHGINYSVPVKIDGVKQQKDILMNISGIFPNGMNAILGPTGGGKTSLLDVLAARKDPKGLSGCVLIDGATRPEDFRLVSGYVVQDDVVVGTLTVRENLAFSAKLRLPKTVSNKEREERVTEIISELGLDKCADTMVGTVFIRGVSGGERKRTNIGMELITRPGVLFLDEPTTGLDANTANSVMLLLSKLSKNGRTIIFSIHQPRYSIYRLFDKLHLLNAGETVFHGPAKDALKHFENIGYECEAHNNPPDFFLDVINGDSVRSSDLEEVTVVGSEAVTGFNGNAAANSKSLADMFLDTSYQKTMEQELDSIWKTYTGNEEMFSQKLDYPTSFLTQLSVVSKRSVLNLLRNPAASTIQLVVMVIFGLIVGGIYFQLDNSLTPGIQNRVGAFFFLVMNMIFSNMGAVEVFIQERVIFNHESASGYYRTSCYFMAKVFCDLLPMRVLPTCVFSAITYWMIGFVPEASNFFIFLLDLVVTSFTACSLAFCMGARINIVGIATLLVSMAYVFMMVFGGFLVNISSLPSWLQWLQYTSIFRYSLNTLLINEFATSTFCPVNVTLTDPCLPGTVYLNEQGIDYSSWGLWQNQVAMGVISIGLLLIAYLQMRLSPKFK
ncbi:broad substrate specificity ATP-binding cassette transporter ABCG2-like isoform X2 [Antedon mediterranea]|uniref:broad substrate specificity ATP-binding cassette transporter ABCG2-like isoform X2 n=1 Tax=Antedon mediterranea TaxID=105859 RepID=UPI003AF6223C